MKRGYGAGGTYNFVLTMFGGCVIRQSQADVAHISLLFLLPSEFERRKELDSLSNATVGESIVDAGAL